MFEYRSGTSGNDRILFLHVPKTGGHWVVTALNAAGVELEPEGGSRHAFLQRVSPGERFTFAFVRDPLTWYGSWWHHCRVIDPLQRVQAYFHPWPPQRFVNLPFEQYVRGCAIWSPGFLSRLYGRFVGPPDAQIQFVGRYERLVDDLVLALQRANQDFDEHILRAFPALNVSAAMPDCSREARELLMESELEAYERFYSSSPSPEPATSSASSIKPDPAR